MGPLFFLFLPFGRAREGSSWRARQKHVVSKESPPELGIAVIHILKLSWSIPEKLMTGARSYMPGQRGQDRAQVRTM
jgi:hypothetical protein